MRALGLFIALAACGDNQPAVRDAPTRDAAVELPYLELPMLADYNHASETIVAASGNDVVLLATNQRFPSADSFEYAPVSDMGPPFRRIAFATSHDRGATFSAPRPLLLSERTDPVVAIGADGSFWAVGTDPDLDSPRTDLLRSVDHGDTFNQIASVPISDKSWIAVDNGRQALWIAGYPFIGLIGFDGTTRAATTTADGISTAYADGAGVHFISDNAFQARTWDGLNAPILEGEDLSAGDIASIFTLASVSTGKLADGGVWVLRSLHDSLKGSPILVRVRQLADEGTDHAISRPGTENFLPAGALDDQGRLHAVWYETGRDLSGKLLYSHSQTADLDGAYTPPLVVDANACPGDHWYPYSSADTSTGARRLREYIGIAITGNRAIISWTHAPDPPSRIRIAHVDF